MGTQNYKFTWYTEDGSKMDVEIYYVGDEITKVFLEGDDISEILDNDYLSELLYNELYEYEHKEEV